MDKHVKSNDSAIFVILSIYLVAILSRYTPGAFMTYNISIYLCFTACVVWVIYIRNRVVELRQRIYLYLIAVLLIMLHMSQLCKYTLFDGISNAERYMWYVYYIPNTLIPLISLYISVMTGKAKKDRLPVYLKALMIPAVLQMILIMTNDSNQLTFIFDEGLSNWRSYRHGTLFFINTAWSYILIIISFVIILKKSYRRKNKTAFYVGLVIALLHYVLTVILLFNPSDNLKVIGIVPVTAPMVYSMTFILFWELMIHLRLFPSNTGYDEIFDIADISAVLMDKKGNVILRSQGIVPAAGEDVKEYSKDIMGGKISWKEDVSMINNLNRSLEKIGEELKEGNNLLIEEAKIKADIARLKVKNEIYDEISSYMKPHFDIIEKSLEGTDELSEEEFRKRLIQASFEACYVKRGAGLYITVKSGEHIKVTDFAIAVVELFDVAKMAGIECGIRVNNYKSLTDQQMLDIFDQSEKELYKAFETGDEVRIQWN